MADEQTSTEERYQELIRAKEVEKKSILSNIDQKTLLIFGIAASLLFYWIVIKKSEQVAKLLPIAAIGGVILWLIARQKQSTMPGIMNEQDRKTMLEQQLRWKLKNTRELPEGTVDIRVDIVSPVQRKDDNPFMSETKFEAVLRDGRIKIFSAEQDVRTGALLGTIDRSNTDFRGTEKHPIKTIPSKQLWEESKRDSFLEKKK